MTQQYIVGELSSLLAELESTRDGFLRDAVGSLRREVESSSLSILPQPAQEALDLTDLICRSSLEQRDADAFCRSLAAATALGDFAVAAGLLP